MTINFTKPRIAFVTATAFVAGVFFASSMDWTTLLRAQNKAGGKALATATQPLADQQNAFVAIAEHVTPAVVSIARRAAARSSCRQASSSSSTSRTIRASARRSSRAARASSFRAMATC
jgi:S1-C subfamily serine protease